MKQEVRAGWRFALVLWALLCDAHAALAQAFEPAPPPGTAPPTSPPAGSVASECFPPCREGYLCHARQCVSLCNPPCPEDQVCVGGRRCEFAPPGSSSPIREPPLPPPVKPFDERSFFMLGFHYGFAGNVELDSDSSTIASTYGFNLRGDVPIERFLVLGPLFQFGSWRPDTAPSRSYYIDADLYIRGRLPIMSKSTNVQLWIGMPIGLTFDIIGQDDIRGADVPAASSTGLGWNVGILGGGAVHFTPKFGLFAELGWMQHKVTHDAEPNLYVRLAQWNLNLGFVFTE